MNEKFKISEAEKASIL